MADSFRALLAEQDYWRWNYPGPVGSPVTVTYSFMAAVPDYAGGAHDGFQPLSPAMQQAARAALAEWAALANVSFREVSDAGAGGQIRFGRDGVTEGGYGYYPTVRADGASVPVAGDIWFGSRDLTEAVLGRGQWGFFALLHEIGHALGLKHPFEGGIILPAASDSYASSVMSYTPAPASGIATPQPGGLRYETLYPSTPMLLDIQAVQHLYGSNAWARSGDDRYGWAPGQPLLQTLRDAGGHDTIDLRNQALRSEVDLDPGQRSSIALRGTEAERRMDLPAGFEGASTPSYDGRNNLAIAADTWIEDLLGGSAGDSLSGNALDNLLRGEGGDDLLRGRGGNDRMDGGAGHDTAAYAGRAAEYFAALLPDGSLRLRDLRAGAPEGRDTLSDLEAFRFADAELDLAALLRQSASAGPQLDFGLRGHAATLVAGEVSVAGARIRRYEDPPALHYVDGTLVFDADAPAAQVARLYQAALGRAPEQAGLSHWTLQLQQGAPLAALAGSFLDAPEFTARHGRHPDDAALVARLYENALGRPGDAAGLDYWQDRMAQGLGRDQLLVGFSESAENRARTAGLLQHGLWLPDVEAALVARLYDAVLDRLPDLKGLSYWATSLEEGHADARELARAFAASAEFQSRYGSLADRDFAAALYRNALDRAPEEAGLTYWTQQLGLGLDRADMVLAFSESPEHVALTRAVILDEAQPGILFA